ILAVRHKWGVSKFWTPEIHLQCGLDGALLGNDQRFRLFNFGSLRLTSAINLRDNSVNPLLGFDFLFSKQNINFRASGEIIFPNFQPLGLSTRASQEFRYTINSYIKIDKPYIRHTSFNQSFVQSEFFRQNAFFLSQNFPFSPYMHLNLNAYYETFSHSFAIFALFSIFLDRHSMNFNIETNQGSVKSAAQYNFSSTSDAGNRYRVTGGVAYDKWFHGYGQVSLENQYFHGGLQLNAYDKAFNYGAQIGGSVGCVGSSCFISRPIESGFALVQVPERQGIIIAQEFGGILGKTNSYGNLVIANLKPYEEVRIQALTRDLDPRISTEHLEKPITVGPGFYTAHRVRFSAPLIRRITFRLARDEVPLMIDSAVSVVGLTTDGFIGKQGLIYLEVPENLTTLEGKTEGDTCSFAFDLPGRSDEIVEDLGDIACQ
ncbi:MAG TPA: fimbria/pilus outer membrane usher protein, partial [Myxococcota bacterium]|nr:fimbria/pilus outer membrane usher protein [Myxococcota bacterium]